jgi:hypothetical protein
VALSWELRSLLLMASPDRTLPHYYSYIRMRKLHGVCMAVIIAASILLPSAQGWPKLCLFNSLTGYPCPFCGLSRSFMAIGHGDFKTAWRYNLLGVPLYVLFATLAIRLTAQPEIKIWLSNKNMVTMAMSTLFAWALKLLLIPRSYW